MKQSTLVLLLLLSTASSAFAANCTAPNSITTVRNVHRGQREYVDFYVKAPMTGTVSVVSASGPNFVEDGSGNTITVAGNRWTEVKFASMYWTCSTLTSFVLPKHFIKDIKNIGQFEGQIAYVIGRHNGHYLGQAWTVRGGQKRLRLKYSR